MSSRLAVRKIVRGRRAVRAIYVTAAISTLYAVLGFMVYALIYPSEVVFVEALLWLIEGLTFFGLALAFQIASSRARVYMLRSEIFKVEALAATAVSVVAILILFWLLAGSIRVMSGSTPIVLSSYLFVSALTSYALERFLHSSMKRYEMRLASVKTVSAKLSLDVAFELAGGTSIIVSNVLGSPLAEKAIVLAAGAYTLYGLLGIIRESLSYLIGLGPRGEVARIERLIKAELGRYGYRLRSLRIEMHGTFAEAEVLIEAPPSLTLAEAGRESNRIARALVSSIPELIRALVIMVPSGEDSFRQRRRL